MAMTQKNRQILQFYKNKRVKYHHVDASLRSWQFRFHDGKKSVVKMIGKKLSKLSKLSRKSKAQYPPQTTPSRS